MSEIDTILQLMRDGHIVLARLDAEENKERYYLRAERGFGYRENLDKRIARRVIEADGVTKRYQGDWIIWEIPEDDY